MPYSGIQKEDWPKVDRCVQDVMKKGTPKERAIPICISAIKGNASLLHLEAATEEEVLALQASLAESSVQASIPTNRILKFEGACLARAEINRNNDGITDEGINQLASTIRLMPLTEEHDKEPRGIFTRGYTDEESTECLVDGFIWEGHFPTFADEVRSGQRQLSMDAEAKLAVCSICGAAFTNSLEYCEHVRHRAAGAVRWLYDLTAVAGGAVRHPAGNGTVFPGREGFTVISHNIAIAEWWKKHWDKEGTIPASAFADKKNRKYPFRGPDGAVDPEGWMAAWRYAHKYNESRVTAVLKRNLPKGYRLEGDSVVKTSGGVKMQIVCSECGHEQEFETNAEKLQAELDAKLAELQEAESKLTEAQEALAGLEAEVEVEKRVVDRFVELAAEAGTEFAQEALPSLRKADDDVFKTFKTMASRLGREPEQEPETPASPPETVVASEPDPQVGADNWTIQV